MGMTIDEAIYCMKSYLPSEEYTHCVECKYYGCKDGVHCKSNDAHQLAVDIMRKYQKIEEMVKQYKKFGNIDFSMQIISGVVEDGNETTNSGSN